MFEKQWVVFAANHKTGFIDFVDSYRTEWGAIRACEKLQERSISEFAHLGKGLVQYYYETCEQWTSRGVHEVMPQRDDNRYGSDPAPNASTLNLLSTSDLDPDALNRDRRHHPISELKASDN